MSNPKRIQLKRTKGWRMPANTVKVDRSTRWGNPYRIGFEVQSAQEAKKEFFYFLCGGGKFHSHRERMGDVGQLKGKNLACWCKPGEPCHADVLLHVANNLPGLPIYDIKRVK